MIDKSCQFLKYIFCYDATKLKKMVKFYVSTWTLFPGPVTCVATAKFCVIFCTHVLFACTHVHTHRCMVIAFINDIQHGAKF